MSKKQKFSFAYPVVEVIKVVDGDTLKMSLDMGFNTHRVVTCRINGIDCPESSTEAGDLCDDITTRWLGDRHDKLTAEPLGLIWRSHSLDKYGRSLGDLFDADNVPLSSYLLNLRIAKEYSGEGRRSWTEQELQNIVDRCKKVIG